MTTANEIAKEHTLLSPAEDATVPVGTAVSFVGESGVESPLTFSVASSPALLSSPDIDSGVGSLQPGTSTYTFVSSKVAGTPRTVYWDASFTRVLLDCEGPPVTFTTPVRTLSIVSPPPTEEELAAARRHEEEAASKKKEEEEAVANDTVSLDGGAVSAQNDREVAVKLSCTGAATCTGSLMLSAKAKAGAGKRKNGGTVTIGVAVFSIAVAKSATIRLALNESGRALVWAAHGHLSATLTIRKTSRVPSSTEHMLSIVSHPR